MTSLIYHCVNTKQTADSRVHQRWRQQQLPNIGRLPQTDRGRNSYLQRWHVEAIQQRLPRRQDDQSCLCVFEQLRQGVLESVPDVLTPQVSGFHDCCQLLRCKEKQTRHCHGIIAHMRSQHKHTHTHTQHQSSESCITRGVLRAERLEEGGPNHKATVVDSVTQGDPFLWPLWDWRGPAVDGSTLAEAE